MTTDVEPVTATTPRPLRRILLSQAWCEVTFLHWAVDPADVAPLLPAGVEPDVLDGATYVGLVPFRMRAAGLLAGPGVPYFGEFPETNVRLYSVDRQGRRGVVFRSLESSRLATVLGARQLGVPYTWARMRVARTGDVWSYTSRRRWPGPRDARSRVMVRVGAQISAPGPLERFLTARWGLHLRQVGHTAYWPNEHPEWPLHTAELLAFDDDLIAAAGLPQVSCPPASVLFSPGVRARFGAPVRVEVPPGDRTYGPS
jgi:uncharacterized protein YqjF (DUF2071 family)